ncbi:hypothetical protein TcasGA2_TC006142 [Tribolium castaneum]|uniref:Uncharacterized protein n=1 Tax=Tribolium castaneum TaxID=7070 RepID=D6WUL6_TRICA|nr:hypothetical protein TcasGA2_TC006142 [Tribolium castaneum]
MAAGRSLERYASPYLDRSCSGIVTFIRYTRSGAKILRVLTECSLDNSKKLNKKSGFNYYSVLLMQYLNITPKSLRVSYSRGTSTPDIANDNCENHTPKHNYNVITYPKRVEFLQLERNISKIAP